MLTFAEFWFLVCCKDSFILFLFQILDGESGTLFLLTEAIDIFKFNKSSLFYRLFLVKSFVHFGIKP